MHWFTSLLTDFYQAWRQNTERPTLSKFDFSLEPRHQESSQVLEFLVSSYFILLVGLVKLLCRKACVCVCLHRSKQSLLTHTQEASQLLHWLWVCLSVAHACAFYHLFGKLMKTSLVQGKAPSRAAINAAEVSSCLLIINASSSRERLNVAKPASICISLLERWLLIMAGRESCLR